MLIFRTNSESSQASEAEFCIIQITHFSRLLFWLLVQIWKFDWFLNMLLSKRRKMSFSIILPKFFLMLKVIQI